MKEILYKFAFATLAVLAFSASGQERAHVHGQGKLLISQQGKAWNLQFILPAKDVLGFEHEAETDEEKARLQQMVKKFSSNDSVVVLNAKCSVIATNHSLIEEHDEHQDALAEEHEHHDIEVEYQFDCQSPVTQIAIKLFNTLDSLSQIEAQWITEQSQGMARLTRSQPFVEW